MCGDGLIDERFCMTSWGFWIEIFWLYIPVLLYWEGLFDIGGLFGMFMFVLEPGLKVVGAFSS